MSDFNLQRLNFYIATFGELLRYFKTFLFCYWQYKTEPLIIETSKQKCVNFSVVLLKKIVQYGIAKSYAKRSEKMYIKRQIDIYDLKANISKIKELGFQVHLDDFGKAYATLEVLQEIPFDAIKIDRKLISVLETNDQNKLLISYGVDIIQGYLIGKAVSFSEAKLILQK